MINATIIGNLGADAKLVTLGQTQALEFSIGSRRSRKDKNGNPQTDWVQITYFRTGLQPFLTKGRTVVVTGELEVHTYSTQTGEVRVGMKVVADRIEFVGGTAQDGQQTQQSQPVQQTQQQAPPQQVNMFQQPAPPPQSGSDLPF